MLLFLMLRTLGKLGSLDFDYIAHKITRLLTVVVVEEHATNSNKTHFHSYLRGEDGLLNGGGGGELFLSA